MARNRTARSIQEDGMRALVMKLNHLPAFRDKDVCFDGDIKHFIDRLEERQIDLVEVIKATFKAVKDHQCEMLYYAHLEDRPIRFNVKTPNVVIGLGCYDSARSGKKVFKFRTVINNFAGRQDSRISTYIIDLENNND